MFDFQWVCNIFCNDLVFRFNKELALSNSNCTLRLHTGHYNLDLNLDHDSALSQDLSLVVLKFFCHEKNKISWIFWSEFDLNPFRDIGSKETGGDVDWNEFGVSPRLVGKSFSSVIKPVSGLCSTSNFQLQSGLRQWVPKPHLRSHHYLQNGTYLTNINICILTRYVAERICSRSHIMATAISRHHLLVH